MRFKTGDRVLSPNDIHDISKGVRYGTISDVYDQKYYPELYAVKWDNGGEERGFLRHGLFTLDPCDDPDAFTEAEILESSDAFPELAARIMQSLATKKAKPHHDVGPDGKYEKDCPACAEKNGSKKHTYHTGIATERG